MKLSEPEALQSFFSCRPPRVSFEFFPPHNEQMETRLWQSVKILSPLQPSFVSVTYGAGGSTRERTHATIARILKETSLVPAAHLTCIGYSREEVETVAREYRQLGVRHIVALRGDMPTGKGVEIFPVDGFRYASELVDGLRRVGEFEISVAAYPETHPEAVSPQADMDNLKRKIDAGATRAITQYFFDIEIYLRFLERVQKAGITVPVVPGILPVNNFAQVVKFSTMCGTGVPVWLARLFEGIEKDPLTCNLVAATVAAEQCCRLAREGVEEFHFYTLNRAELTRATCHMLGLRSR